MNAFGEVSSERLWPLEGGKFAAYSHTEFFTERYQIRLAA